MACFGNAYLNITVSHREDPFLEQEPLVRDADYSFRWNVNLWRDNEKEGRNLQKTSVTDGSLSRCKERSGPVIEMHIEPAIYAPWPLTNMESLAADG